MGTLGDLGGWCTAWLASPPACLERESDPTKMREFFLTQCWLPIQLQCGSRSSMPELCNALYKLNVLFVLLCFNFRETVRLSGDLSRTPILCEGRGGFFTVNCHRGIRCLAQLGLGSPGAPCFCRGCVTRQCVETSVSI